MVRSVSTLGHNIGAVDFLLRDDVPVLLEVNPIWGSVPGPYAFGNASFERRVEETESFWTRALPNIVENLDVVAFYRRLYELIADASTKPRADSEGGP